MLTETGKRVEISYERAGPISTADNNPAESGQPMEVGVVPKEAIRARVQPAGDDEDESLNRST
jgi:hypothetical protein